MVPVPAGDYPNTYYTTILLLTFDTTTFDTTTHYKLLSKRCEEVDILLLLLRLLLLLLLTSATYCLPNPSPSPHSKWYPYLQEEEAAEVLEKIRVMYESKQQVLSS